ncbi:MAG: hypothetical protein LUP99_02540 [Methanomicrobiales archaeon]|nr:hypothetical protein [Methanomicrobiales archaeon]
MELSGTRQHPAESIGAATVSSPAIDRTLAYVRAELLAHTLINSIDAASGMATQCRDAVTINGTGRQIWGDGGCRRQSGKCGGWRYYISSRRLSCTTRNTN